MFAPSVFLLDATTFNRENLPPQSVDSSAVDMGSCQNYGPFVGTLNIRCRIIIRTQKGTIILTTTHMKLKTLIP